MSWTAVSLTSVSTLLAVTSCQALQADGDRRYAGRTLGHGVGDRAAPALDPGPPAPHPGSIVLRWTPRKNHRTHLEREVVPLHPHHHAAKSEGWSSIKIWAWDHACGLVVLASGFALWICFIPYLLVKERNHFHEQHIEGRSFTEYAKYRFNYWMSTNGMIANAWLLLACCLTLLVSGAMFYWLISGKSPIEGLWLVFVYLSASSANPRETSPENRLVSVLTTAGGLLLLALLLGTVSDYFAERVAAFKEGRDAVVEGNHLLILGFSSHTKPLLEELAIAGESITDEEPLTIVLMGDHPKADMERSIHGENTNLGKNKLVVRSGNSNDWQDLKKVAADTARAILIPEDPAKTRSESDAHAFGTLLTLRGQGWPKKGHVTAQCCLWRNAALMENLCNDKTAVFNCERLGRLMVQSARDHGLCQVFSQIIGFEGDEFYERSALELGVVGRTFRDLAFMFPVAIPLGLVDKEGQVLINPSQNYLVTEEDHIIVLAEDSGSWGACPEPFFNYHQWLSARQREASFREDARDSQPTKVLICNLHDRGYGCAILFALDDICAPGSEVDIFTGMTEAACLEVLEDSQRRQQMQFQNIRVSIYYAPEKNMASVHELEMLPLHSYEHMFVLADTEGNVSKADQKTVAMIIQMQSLLSHSTRMRVFNPVVEICNAGADTQLQLCGVTNSVNTNLILSRALAIVAMNPISHGVLRDLLSQDGNNFDICILSNYLPPGEKTPWELSFAEATAIVCRAAQQILIGWSEGVGVEMRWIINPKDKTKPRLWMPEDRIVVIKDV